MGKLIDPGKLTRVCREVAEGGHVKFQVAFFLCDVPFAVVATHDLHRLLFFDSPAEIIVDRAT